MANEFAVAAHKYLNVLKQMGVEIYSSAGTPTDSGPAKGALCVDTTNGKLYINTGTAASATWDDVAAIAADEITCAQGKILIGNDSGVAAAQTMSGDATLATSGAITLAANSVETAMITDDAVTTAKIADANVTTALITDDAVTNALIADNAVDSAQITADAVTNAKVADNAVDTAQLTDDAVTNAKVADNAIDTAQITADAVTTAKIADANVTTALITDDAVTNALIADNAVDSAQITADAVTNAKVADNAVDTAQITASAVTNAKVADNTIKEAKLNGAWVTGTLTTAGTPETFAHGLGDTPAVCFAGMGDAWVTTYDGTNITVDADSNGESFGIYALL